MTKEIKESLSKAKAYLLSKQNEEGYWSSVIKDIKGPEHLQKPIAITSQVIDALIYLNLENVSPIDQGIFYCYKEKVEDTDSIDLLSMQLNALSYSNAPFIEKKAKHLLKVIINRQNKEGFWPSFPKTSNLTNFLVIESIKKYDTKESLKKIKTWLVNNKAKDGLGWGINEDSDKSQVSFTADASLILLNSNESPNVIKFLESKQSKDGGWPSSDLTYPVESTIYATALVCLVLIKTDINNKALESGINFLVNSQLQDGSWPLKKGDTEGVEFATCLAIKTLVYYNYIKEKLKENNIIELIEKTNKQNVINYLLKEFENNKRKEFLDVNFNKILDKILATTSQAVKRRKIILNILENDGEKDTANIIDELKKIEGYKGLHKKSHLAQIKNDMDALVNLELVEEHGRRYFLVKKINP